LIRKERGKGGFSIPFLINNRAKKRRSREEGREAASICDRNLIQRRKNNLPLPRKEKGGDPGVSSCLGGGREEKRGGGPAVARFGKEEGEEGGKLRWCSKTLVQEKGGKKRGKTGSTQKGKRGGNQHPANSPLKRGPPVRKGKRKIKEKGKGTSRGYDLDKSFLVVLTEGREGGKKARGPRERR